MIGIGFLRINIFANLYTVSAFKAVEYRFYYFQSDIVILENAFDSGVTTETPISYRHDRLISVGLLTNENRLSGNIFMTLLDSDKPQNIIDLTDIGKTFCNIIFH